MNDLQTQKRARKELYRGVSEADVTKSLEDSSFSQRVSGKESERDGSSSLKREMKQLGETDKKLNKRGRKPKGD